MTVVLDDFFHADLPEKAVCVAIGNFDGVHYAHQAIIRQLVARAEEEACASVVLSFDPHPAQLYHRPDALVEDEFFLLHTKAEKTESIAEIGVDFIIFINFTPEFSRLTAEEFVELLYSKLRMKMLLVGYNFRFGWQREASAEDLKQMLAVKDIPVEVFPSFQTGTEKLCSSTLRQALIEGNVELFHEFTGRFFKLNGRVVHGDGRGSKIGFPTANLQIRTNRLAGGVYAVKAVCEAGTFPALANFGNCPTFRDFSGRRLEVYIPDFSANLYDQEISVQFVHKIRDELKFPDKEALCTAIKRDLQVLRDFSRNW
jgi:riboflavin kinase/FMN adenylyltransferase